MKKSILFVVLLSMSFAMAVSGCRTEAEVGDDGVKLDIDGK